MTISPRYTDPVGVPAPLSSYSNVAVAGDFAFVAGQIGVDAEGRLAGPGVAEQTVQAYDNVRTALAVEGGSLRDVVRFVTYLVSRDDVAEFYRAREEYFARLLPDGDFPPNTLLIVAGLVQPEFRVEIDATASVTR